MKHEINLWQDHPPDWKWDLHDKAKLLNIIFMGGSFGNFTKFFIDKFSKKSPDIGKDPFTGTGTSHSMKQSEYSGIVQTYHPSFINYKQQEKDLPICIIVPTSRKHHLYLKTSQSYRALDQKHSPDILWQTPVKDMPEEFVKRAVNIIKLYNITQTQDNQLIPKFIVRDWYKLDFLQPLESTYDYEWFETLKNHKFFDNQNVFHLDLETFFDWNIFLQNISKLNNKFDLALDFDRKDEMKSLFDRGYQLDTIRQECNLIENVIDNKTLDSLDNLSVITEAYLYAHFERKYPKIQMPLINKFFSTSNEIQQYIDHFPAWYCKPNPNLQ